MKIGERKAQMQLSFGMIFSIILIIIFIIFAFYAIRSFLRVNDSAKVGNFINSLQEDVDSIWKAAKGSQEASYTLPSNVNKICFENRGDGNLVFYDNKNERVDNTPIADIKHINLTIMLRGFPPPPKACHNVTEEKVKMLLEKKYGEELVTIKRA